MRQNRLNIDTMCWAWAMSMELTVLCKKKIKSFDWCKTRAPLLVCWQHTIIRRRSSVIKPIIWRKNCVLATNHFWLLICERRKFRKSEMSQEVTVGENFRLNVCQFAIFTSEILFGEIFYENSIEGTWRVKLKFWTTKWTNETTFQNEVFTQ